MTRYAVRHATVYEYGGDVAHSHHLLHLTPREFEFQRCLEHSLTLDPQPNSRYEDVDPFGNAIARLEYDRPHDGLSVTSEMHVEILPRRVNALEDSDSWDAVRSRLSYGATPMPAADLEACRFRMQSSYVRIKQAIGDYAEDCFAPGRSIAAVSAALMRKIHREFDYAPGSTTNRTSVLEVLTSRRGVCQDFAHLMIGCLRATGLAARYVSGYIRTVRTAPVRRSRRRCVARVGVSVLSARWVGWISIPPTTARRRRSRHPRVGPGFRRCFPASRHDRRRRATQAQGRCSRTATGTGDRRWWFMMRSPCCRARLTLPTGAHLLDIV